MKFITYWQVSIWHDFMPDNLVPGMIKLMFSLK